MGVLQRKRQRKSFKAELKENKFPTEFCLPLAKKYLEKKRVSLPRNKLDMVRLYVEHFGSIEAARSHLVTKKIQEIDRTLSQLEKERKNLKQPKKGMQLKDQIVKLDEKKTFLKLERATLNLEGVFLPTRNERKKQIK